MNLLILKKKQMNIKFSNLLFLFTIIIHLTIAPRCRNVTVVLLAITPSLYSRLPQLLAGKTSSRKHVCKYYRCIFYQLVRFLLSFCCSW